MATKETQTFEDLMHELDAGACSSGLTHAVREVLSRNAEVALDAGKAKGEITLKITFVTTGQSGMTDVKYNIVPKPAPRPTQKTTLYATPGGGFSARDPRQEPLRFASTASTAAKAGAQS